MLSLLGLISYFIVLKALTILFKLIFYQFCSKSKWDFDFDFILKFPFFFCKFFENFSPFPYHFFTYNTEYYGLLRRHIQIGRLPVQGTWLCLVTLSVILGSM